MWAEVMRDPRSYKAIHKDRLQAFQDQYRTIEADRDRLGARVAGLEAQARWLAGEIRKRDSLLARAMATIDRLEAGR